MAKYESDIEEFNESTGLTHKKSKKSKSKSKSGSNLKLTNSAKQSNKGTGTKKSNSKSKTSSKTKQKTGSKVKSESAPRKRVRSLDPLREQLSVLVNQANKKVDALTNNGLNSRALQEATRSLLRQSSRVDDDTLFRSNLRTRQQINREFARVHAFLNDYTSSVEGAYDFESKLKNYKGAFGHEWQAEYGENYDKSRIDEEKAKLAFDIYRRVVEAAGGWERAVGIFQGKESLIGYGSENLIIAIYDMVENISSESFTDEDARKGYIIQRGLSMVNEGIKAYDEMAARQVSDFDYGIVFDDETAKERRAWFSWLFDNRKIFGR